MEKQWLLVPMVIMAMVLTVAIGSHGNHGNGIYSYNSTSNKWEHVGQYLDNKDPGDQSYYSVALQTKWEQVS